jgi:prevent-host-death family protein
MSDAANAYELPADQTVPADVVRVAADGEVVYLTRDGTPVAALVSADAADPADQVWAELGVDGRG